MQMNDVASQILNIVFHSEILWLSHASSLKNFILLKGSYSVLNNRKPFFNFFLGALWRKIHWILRMTRLNGFAVFCHGLFHSTFMCACRYKNTTFTRNRIKTDEKLIESVFLTILVRKFHSYALNHVWVCLFRYVFLLK